MRNIKLTLEYDGTHFSGFQAQPRKRTVQSELEKAFLKLFREKIKISSAAGRTDAGVHARAQVVNFKIASEIPIQNIERALNTYLPEDLAVRKAEEVSPEFHARFQAKSKTYEYLVWNSKTRSPLLAGHAYHFPYPLNMPLMKKTAKLIIGKHDFKSFESKSEGKNSVRTIFSFSIQKKRDKIRFLIAGDGFLYNMIRSLVGTLLFVGTGKIQLADFRKILRNKTRQHLGPTLPAHGLTLMKVEY